MKPKENGFTLIELLIAMAITGIVTAGIYSAFSSQQKSYLIQEDTADMQQNLRVGMDLMTREIRMAGYDPNKTNSAGITNMSVDGNGNSTIEFTMVADDDGLDNNNDGTTDETGELNIIKYDIYDAYGDGSDDLGRQVGTVASTKRSAGENIEALELFCKLADGTQTLNPPDLTVIRSIQITMLAKTDRIDQNFYNATQYTTPGGQNWGPYNDSFRRRLLTTTVKCRNMGL